LAHRRREGALRRDRLLVGERLRNRGRQFLCFVLSEGSQRLGTDVAASAGSKRERRDSLVVRRCRCLRSWPAWRCSCSWRSSGECASLPPGTTATSRTAATSSGGRHTVIALGLDAEFSEVALPVEAAPDPRASFAGEPIVRRRVRGPLEFPGAGRCVLHGFPQGADV